jgi:hypothetical protein
MITNIVELFDNEGFLLEEYINPNFLGSVNYAHAFITYKTTGYKLCIFYADPAGVNGYWDPILAGQYFSNFDYIIFGYGVQDPTNPNFSQNLQTINEILKINPNCLIFGYIDLGVTTSNLSFQTIENNISQWKAIGAKGIMYDDAGYDYHVSRSRLNTAIDLAHSNGLVTCINALVADDVFSSSVNPTYNPDGLSTAITSDDYYLLESLVYDDTNYTTANGYSTNTGFSTLSDIKFRAQSSLTYRSEIGCKLLASSVYTPSKTSTFNQNAIFDTIEATAIILGLDGYSFDESGYSATGSNAGQYFYFNYNKNYNDIKSQYGIDSITQSNNGNAYALKYKQSIVYINGTSYYSVSDLSRTYQLKTTVNLGSTAAASLSSTISSPIFSASKPVVACAIADSTNSTPVAISVNPSDGSLTVTVNALSGTISGNIDINLIC